MASGKGEGRGECGKRAGKHERAEGVQRVGSGNKDQDVFLSAFGGVVGMRTVGDRWTLKGRSLG